MDRYLNQTGQTTENCGRFPREGSRFEPFEPTAILGFHRAVSTYD